jgi:hypothetical protein
MSFRRAAQYTWKAFLTFLMIGIPGILLQNIASWLIGSWSYVDSDNRPNVSMMGWMAMANGFAGLWVQFSVIFVIFKYVPSAIAEVQENRAVARAGLSPETVTETASDLEQ